MARDINSIFVAKNDKSKASGAMMLNNLASAAKLRNFGAFSEAKRQAQDRSISFDALIPNSIIADSDVLRAYKKAQNFFNQSSPRPANEVVSDLRKIHDSVKRLTRQGKTRIDRGRGDYLGKFIADSKGQLNAYIKERQDEVGKLKAGWWNAILSLPKPKKKGVEQNFGRKGVAAYVKKFPGNVIQNVKTSQRAVNILVGNTIGNNDNKATKNSVLQLVYGNATNRIQLDLENFLQRDVRNFNNGKIR